MCKEAIFTSQDRLLLNTSETAEGMSDPPKKSSKRGHLTSQPSPFWMPLLISVQGEAKSHCLTVSCVPECMSELSL